MKTNVKVTPMDRPTAAAALVAPTAKVLTAEILKSVAPYVNANTHHISDKSAELFLPYLLMYQGEVNTPLRMAAFLANILHESGCLKWVRELASGDAYEGREDLGNVHHGDGRRFKGRGLIQITGRANYSALSKDWYGDFRLVNNPELLATPENAVKSAYWYWDKRKLNSYADAGDFLKIVKIINGGTNGLKDRQRYYAAALKVLQ